MSGDHNMNQTDSGWRKRQIALDKNAENARELGLDYDVHSCSPFCDRPMCVAVREAVQAEREGVEDLLKEYDMVNSAFARDFRARGKEPCTHEWTDDTKDKPAWRCIKCGSDYKKEQA